MKNIPIALVLGDGAAPDMMRVACDIVSQAARYDDAEISFVETPMGWNAHKQFGDTFPEESFAKASEIGTLFFGGVGDPELDKTLGKQFPEMRPEARCLLGIRDEWDLLLNFRPMIYRPDMKDFMKVRPEFIPDEGVEQHWIRFLLEDTYFGTKKIRPVWNTKFAAKFNGVLLKDEVTGDEEQVIDLAYFNAETIKKYLRYAFQYAKQKNLPLISIDKSNVMARYKLWRDIATRIGAEEFPEVDLRHLLVDAANALLFEPAKLHGVIACGNEHGDILSDGAAGAIGSLGLMHSSAINPDTGQAMFESGAGTAADLAGQDKANPIGRILTAGMMLRHLELPTAADAIEYGVKAVLDAGWRTGDIATASTPGSKVVGTTEMGRLISTAIGKEA